MIVAAPPIQGVLGDIVVTGSNSIISLYTNVPYIIVINDDITISIINSILKSGDYVIFYFSIRTIIMIDTTTGSTTGNCIVPDNNYITILHVNAII